MKKPMICLVFCSFGAFGAFCILLICLGALCPFFFTLNFFFHFPIKECSYRKDRNNRIFERRERKVEVIYLRIIVLKVTRHT